MKYIYFLVSIMIVLTTHKANAGDIQGDETITTQIKEICQQKDFSNWKEQKNQIDTLFQGQKMSQNDKLNLYFYAFISVSNNQNLSPQIRNDLLKIVLLGVSEQDEYLAKRCDNLLWQLMEKQIINIEKNSSEYELLLNKFNSMQYVSRDLLLIADSLQFPMLEKNLKIIAKSRYGGQVHESSAWIANVLLARRGYSPAINRAIKIAHNSDLTFGIRLFEDMRTIKNEKIISFFDEILNSEEIMPSFTRVPNDPIAYFAAKSLDAMLINFPQGKYNDLKHIEKCRKWMKEQKEFKFK